MSRNITVLTGIFVVLMVPSRECQGQLEKKGQRSGSNAGATVRIHGGCIYLIGTGNAKTLRFGNACNETLQFTVHWDGGQPPQDVTYHINNSGSRNVVRRDTQGVVIAEVRAQAGLGPQAHFSIEDRNISGDQHLLVLVNAESAHIFVHGHVFIRDSSGQQIQDCQPAMVLKPLGREPACVYFTGQAHAEVLQADKDPD